MGEYRTYTNKDGGINDTYIVSPCPVLIAGNSLCSVGREDNQGN